MIIIAAPIPRPVLRKSIIYSTYASGAWVNDRKIEYDYYVTAPRNTTAPPAI